MNVHLIDGTYELFRHFYAMPSEKDASGHEIPAVHGVVGAIRGVEFEADDALASGAAIAARAPVMA